MKPRRSIESVRQHSSQLLIHLIVCTGRSVARLALIVHRCFGKLAIIFQHLRSNKRKPGFHANSLPKMATASRRRNHNQREGQYFSARKGRGRRPKTFFNYWKVINFRVHSEERRRAAASTGPDPYLARRALYEHVGGSKHSGSTFPKLPISHSGLFVSNLSRL